MDIALLEDVAGQEEGKGECEDWKKSVHDLQVSS